MPKIRLQIAKTLFFEGWGPGGMGGALFMVYPFLLQFEKLRGSVAHENKAQPEPANPLLDAARLKGIDYWNRT
jgi:hypothetical protein